MDVRRTHSDDIADFAIFAEKLADHCRELARRGFHTIASFHSKEDGSPVTAVDESIEADLIRLIRKAYPDHGILGEEFGTEHTDREFVWVVDPIDGTKSFASGTSTFGSLIALCRNRVPIVGIIELPVSAWRYVGVAGSQTTFNGHPVAVRRNVDLADCVLSASGGEFFRGPAPWEGFENLRQRCNWTVYGAGCSAFGSLSRGLIDICLEGANLASFDYCALVPVVEGAGGRITDWRGQPLALVSDMAHRAQGVVATGDPKLHATVLEHLAT